METEEQHQIVQKYRQKLAALAEPAYQRFAASLIPGCTNLMGVRLPVLRKFARQMNQQETDALLEEKHPLSFEETMLQGMLISGREMPFKQRISCVLDFLPRITNWSLCDSFCAGFWLKEEEKEEMFSFLEPLAESQEEFTVRFSVVMAMQHYLEKPWLSRTLSLLRKANPKAGVYARMGISWAVSMAYIKAPAETQLLLTDENLEADTVNLAIRKIRESKQATLQQKAFVRTLRRVQKEVES